MFGNTSPTLLTTHYSEISALGHRDLDQILRKWAVLSQFQADLDYFDQLARSIHENY